MIPIKASYLNHRLSCLLPPSIQFVILRFLTSKQRNKQTKNNVKNHDWNFRTLKCMLHPWPWPGKVANSSIKTRFVKFVTFVTISLKRFSSQTSNLVFQGSWLAAMLVHKNEQQMMFDLNSSSKTLLMQWIFNVIEIMKEVFKVHL